MQTTKMKLKQILNGKASAPFSELTKLSHIGIT